MYISCSGNWGQRGSGDIYCDTTATIVTETELAQSMLAQNQLDNEDFAILLGAAVLMMVYCLQYPHYSADFRRTPRTGLILTRRTRCETL